MNKQHPTAFTTGEIAKFCGVSFRTISRWIKDGKLKGYKLPGARGDHRVKTEELLLFLEQNQIPIPDELKDIQALRKALVVEDDEIIAMGILKTLEKAGLEVEWAKDGFQAGHMFATFKPHIITLDLNMPNFNGIELLRYLQQSELFATTKIIVVSGSRDKEIEKALELGASDFLTKPFKNSDLVAKTFSLLS